MINKLTNLTLNSYFDKNISNHILITSSFIDLVDIEEMVNTNKVPNFALLFDNLNIKQIVEKSKLVSKYIIFHQKYEFLHFDFEFLQQNYETETIKMYIYELYNNHFLEDLKELIQGLRQILRFYRQIETKKKKFTKELRTCIVEICYCIKTIKHFFINNSWIYLENREISLQKFYSNFQKLMSKSRWRVMYINLFQEKIINVSDHLNVLKTKREQNFILWTIIGATIGMFVKEAISFLIQIIFKLF